MWLAGSTPKDDIDAMMAELKTGLDAPLASMATAFSSSLFRLAGSLILGFDLQLGQASGRFYDGEDGSGPVRFEQMTEEASPQLVQGLSEAAADKMQELARVRPARSNANRLPKVFVNSPRN